MKRILLVLFLASCSTATPIANNHLGLPLLMCSPPELYFIGETIPDEMQEYILDSFNYWNLVLGKLLFYYAGSTRIYYNDPQTYSYIVVDMKSSHDTWDEDTAAISHMSEDERGCSYNMSILLNPKALNWNDDKLATLMRHEIGHLLGLNHNDSRLSLMYKRISEKNVHPVRASEEDIEKLRRYYND